MRHVSNAQVRKLMEEMSKHGHIGVAAMKADMDRKTARKYVAAGELPSEMVAERSWRTRADPFVDVWPEVEQMLVDAPGLEAKTVFDALQLKYPDRFVDGHVRSLQRKVRLWRSSRGPDKAVTFAQRHRPGEAAQTDFTSTNELAVTVAGAPYEHLLCNARGPRTSTTSHRALSTRERPAARQDAGDVGSNEAANEGGEDAADVVRRQLRRTRRQRARVRPAWTRQDPRRVRHRP